MRKKSNALTLCVLICTVVFALALLFDAQSVGDGIRKGLSISAGVLIPSLFPFMALCGFISASGIGARLSKLFAFLTDKVFKLPAEYGSIVLLSLVGGYPAGTRMISDLLKEKGISEKTAERMLCFCVNAGPPFMLTAVGAGMFLSREAGIALLVSQVLTTIIIGAAVSRGVKPELNRGITHQSVHMGFSAAFVQAVAGAASAMITLCAFAVFFSGIMEMVKSSGIIGMISLGGNYASSIAEAVLCGFFEVTSGCIAAARIGGAAGFALASMSVSFGGISVVFQIMSFFRDNPISMKPYLLSRLAHMGLSAIISATLYNLFCNSSPVIANTASPEMLVGGRTFIITACLIGMSTILLIPERSHGKGDV